MRGTPIYEILDYVPSWMKINQLLTWRDKIIKMKVVFLVAIVSSLVDAEVSEDAAAAAAGAEDPLASLDAQWEDEFGLEVTTTAPYFTH